jgi:AcrR family transcriptional regulator
MPQDLATPTKDAMNKCIGKCVSREEKQTRRQCEIVAKAIELFARHGYADTDTQLLADQLGIGKGTLYRYFSSKEELFLSAVDYGMRDLHKRMEHHLDADIDPLEKIRCGIRTYLDFFVEHLEVVELLIQERALFKDRRKPTYFHYREKNINRWQAVYAQLIAEGRIRPMPPERITDFVGDLLYGTMFTNYFSGRTPDPQRQAEAILDFICFGILTDGERAACAASAAESLSFKCPFQGTTV